MKKETEVRTWGEEVPPEALVADPEIQMRVAMDEKLIEEYAAAYREGATFPEIEVVADGEGQRFVWDGFHRREAAIRAGRATVPVRCREGTRRDAILKAVSANASHGLRRTNAGKEKAVLKLLDDPEWGKRSAHWIAKKAQVSHTYVNNLKAKRQQEAAAARAREEAAGRMPEGLHPALLDWWVKIGQHDPELTAAFIEHIPRWAQELAAMDVAALLPMISRQQFERIEALGIETIAELIAVDPATLPHTHLLQDALHKLAGGGLEGHSLNFLAEKRASRDFLEEGRAEGVFWSAEERAERPEEYAAAVRHGQEVKRQEAAEKAAAEQRARVEEEAPARALLRARAAPEVSAAVETGFLTLDGGVALIDLPRAVQARAIADLRAAGRESVGRAVVWEWRDRWQATGNVSTPAPPPDQPEPPTPVPAEPAPEPPPPPGLASRIEELDFSVRTHNCLKKAGVNTLAALVQQTEAELMNIRNFGRKSVFEVRDKLAELGLCLPGPRLDDRGEDEDDEAALPPAAPRRVPDWPESWQWVETDNYSEELLWMPARPEDDGADEAGARARQVAWAEDGVACFNHMELEGLADLGEAFLREVGLACPEGLALILARLQPLLEKKPDKR